MIANRGDQGGAQFILLGVGGAKLIDELGFQS
jgi:hypothetical protein